MKFDNEPKYLENQPAADAQNWGLIIGVSLVTLCIVVMVVNLSGAKVGANLPLWGQLGRVAGLGVSLGGGGWLLWRLLRRRQSADHAYVNDVLSQAVNYTRQIEELLQSGTNGREQPLLTHIHTWRQTIEAMAQALVELNRHGHFIQRDLSQLPGAIIDLERQLAAETNPLLRADLEQMLTQRRHQQQAIKQLQTTRRRAEIQIERTIAVLGTIYSQLLTYRSTSHVVDYQHLANHVAEEVQQLQDYLEALQEVKGGR